MMMISYISNRIVYILIAVILIVSAFVDRKVARKQVHILLLIGCLIVFSLFGILRGKSVGLDTNGYSLNYYSCRNITNVSAFLMKNKPEFLFYGLMYAFSKILNLPEIVFYIFEYSLISCCLFFAFRNQKSALAKMSLMFFLGFFIMSYSGIRQTISMAILTFAISFFLYGSKQAYIKYIVFYSCLIVAVGFHSSALMLIPFPLILKIKLSEKSFIFLIPLLFFVPSIAKNLMTFASTLVYVNYDVGTYRVSFTFIFFILVLIVLYVYIGLPWVSQFLNNKIKIYKVHFDDEMNALIWNLYLALIFMSCNVFSLVVPRYAMYFYFGIGIFIIRLIDSFEKEVFKTVALISSLVIFGGYFILSVSNLGLVPYRFL